MQNIIQNAAQGAAASVSNAAQGAASNKQANATTALSKTEQRAQERAAITEGRKAFKIDGTNFRRCLQMKVATHLADAFLSKLDEHVSEEEACTMLGTAMSTSQTLAKQVESGKINPSIEIIKHLVKVRFIKNEGKYLIEGLQAQLVKVVNPGSILGSRTKAVKEAYSKAILAYKALKEASKQHQSNGAGAISDSGEVEQTLAVCKEACKELMKVQRQLKWLVKPTSKFNIGIHLLLSEVGTKLTTLQKITELLEVILQSSEEDGASPSERFQAVKTALTAESREIKDRAITLSLGSDIAEIKKQRELWNSYQSLLNELLRDFGNISEFRQHKAETAVESLNLKNQIEENLKLLSSAHTAETELKPAG